MVNVIHKGVQGFFVLLFITMFSGNIASAVEGQAVPRQAANGFIENKGQVRDQHNNPRPEIDFKLPAGALNIFIGTGELHYQWMQPLTKDDDDRITQYKGYRLDVTLEGANIHAQPTAESPLGYYERYYILGLDGAIANAYRKIVYKEIYPHIDWVLYMTERGLKYDFLVHPGGRVSDIKIRYTGAEKITQEHGEITATTPMGTVTENAPFTYSATTKTPLSSEYILEENTISFKIEPYSGSIVIDPSLEWATYMGGGSGDFGLCASSDTAGNVYMAGFTASANSSNVYTSLAHQTVFGGNDDGVVTKYTAGGVRQWSTYYGGAGREAINSITVDKQNNIIFCGWTDTSYTGIASSSSTVHQPAHGGGKSDAFLVKMTPGGTRLWATYYGGDSTEQDGNYYQCGVVCDTALNIYLAGITASDTGIATTTSGIQQTSRAGGSDGFLAKFNSNGVRQWGTYYGGSANDRFTIAGADSAGVVYVAGNFRSTGMGTGSTHSTNKPGGSEPDILIAKFNPATGGRIWATYYGGSGDDDARGLVVGDSSMVYICGSTASTSGIASSIATQGSYGGGYYDMFISKFDSTGNRVWGTYLGGDQTDHGGNVVLDHKGNLNATGMTNSEYGISTPDAFNVNLSDGLDALIAIYNSAGDKVWGTYYGGAGNDYGYGVARGKSSGHIYFTGNTESSSNISYNGSQNTYGGNNDAFMVKITPDTSVSIVKTSVQNTYCESDSFIMSYVVTEPFRPGNTFTVQLSNSSGSFASPVNIGTQAGNMPGSLKVGLPPNTSGSAFRIRIVATLPVDTSYDNDFDILIKPLPVKPVATNSSPACSNDTLKLFSTASTSGSTYSWTGPDNYIAGTQNPIRTNMTAALHSGDYIVTANLNGCVRKDTTTATILQAAPKPNLVSNAPLCTGDNLSMAAGNLTTGLGMKWAGPNGFSDTGTVNSGTEYKSRLNVVLADAGNYIFTQWMNGCPSRDTVAVTIAPRPSPVTANSNSPVCTHETLNLTANTSTPGVVYNWTGPGGFIANNQQNPTRTNLQTSHSGDYIVEADMLGCKVKDTVTVVINQSPAKPEVTANKTALCSDEDLLLTAGNVTGGTNRQWTGPGSWNGGTGTTATRNNIQVPDAGNYIFTATMPNGCKQSDTVTISVTKSWKIPVTAIADPGTVVCPTAEMKFYTLGKPIGASVKWTNPALQTYPNQDTLPIASAAYSDSGWYVVEVVTGACSLAVDSVHLSVVDTISPPVLTLPPYDCEGDSMKVIFSHPYLIKFDVIAPGDSAIGIAGVTINSLDKNKHNGRWIVRVESGGCKAADTGYLEVRSSPAKPNANNNGPLCEGETLDLSANSTTPGVTYSWQGPSGYSSGAQNPSRPNVKSATDAGFYIAKAFANGCFSRPDSTEVKIILNPNPVIVTDERVCEGADIQLGLATIVPDENYGWSAPGNPGFSGSGPSATLSNAGLNNGGAYVVTATSGSTGCVGKDTAWVAIIPLPGIPDAFYNGPLCSGDTMVLGVDDTSTNVSYVWKGPNGYTDINKQAYKTGVDTPDSGPYTVTVEREGCLRHDTLDVLVKPRPPVPDITSNSPLSSGEDLKLEMRNPITGASFQWRGPNNYGSLVQNPVINNATRAATGTYSLVTTVNGCSSSAITIVIVNPGEGEKEELILFPNPNKGTFTVKAKVLKDQIMPFEVVNILGMVVYSDIVPTDKLLMERKIEIDGGLSSGVYIFRIMMSGQSREIPFSIVR